MKPSNKKLLAATAFSLLTAASQQLMAAADTVIRYGKIYTVNPAKPWADAIAIKNGVITYVGNNRGVRQHIGYNTEVINLYNQDLVLPGLHDIHMHPLEAGSDNISCTVQANTVDQWLSAIQTCANRGNGWVLGWGFNINKLLEDGRSPKQLLDNISSTRPIAIMEQTSHSAWVNSKALQQIGFDNSTNNPPGGHLGKTSSGDLNGILLDTAGDDVSSLSPFAGMKHALQRGNKSLPNLAAAVQAYTINAAYALRQDHLVGSIEVGKRADLTIVDRNIFNIAVDNLDKTKVLMTVVDGKFVYF